MPNREADAASSPGAESGTEQSGRPHRGVAPLLPNSYTNRQFRLGPEDEALFVALQRHLVEDKPVAVMRRLLRTCVPLILEGKIEVK